MGVAGGDSGGFGGSGGSGGTCDSAGFGDLGAPEILVIPRISGFRQAKRKIRLQTYREEDEEEEPAKVVEVKFEIKNVDFEKLSRSQKDRIRNSARAEVAAGESRLPPRR